MSAQGIFSFIYFGIQTLGLLYKAGRCIEDAPPELQELLRKTLTIEECFQRIHVHDRFTALNAHDLPTFPDNDMLHGCMSLVDRAQKLEKGIQKLLERIAKVDEDRETSKVKTHGQFLTPSEAADLTANISEFYLATVVISSTRAAKV